MALHIVNPQADALARELAELTGQSISSAVVEALQERLRQVQGLRHRKAKLEKMREIARESAIHCRHDPASPDEIIGYDDAGLPR